MSFCDDVVYVARNFDPGGIEQIARDYGVHLMMLWKWIRRAAIGEGANSGQAWAEAVELREARKRIRLLEQDNEVGIGRRGICHRRTCGIYSRQVTELANTGFPVAVEVSGAHAFPASPTTDIWRAASPRRGRGANCTKTVFDAHRDELEFGRRLLADEARDNDEAMSDRSAWPIACSDGWSSTFGKPNRSQGRRSRSTSARRPLCHGR
ncbi:hypothetical protein OS128_06675 [Corynebacterium sp. P5848]|uniref:hypothetical protein n=1 Tax=Corynebacterium marambiense TaxID=2765364 RepID=UPI0022608517|nr:hypothetical protein [Corynebacterium marambiense]MCX7542596.1 hypothetical protein [Corynebacterium marambiense]